MIFSFGKNWHAYSQKALTQKKLDQFSHDFETLFKDIDLKSKRFIDIGFGQGLTVLWAAEKGADVLGIDIDKENITALGVTQKKMRSHHKLKTEIVSILDDDYIRQFKNHFDIVHTWGVLHHTGNMKKAFENSCALVAHDGYFICSIYNRHWSSPAWKLIKYLYNRSPAAIQKLFIGIFYPIIYTAKWVVTGRDPHRKERGMDFFYDVIDWVGGYPYEYATEQEIIDIVSQKGLHCIRTSPASVPTGCNEFIFKKG